MTAVAEHRPAPGPDEPAGGGADGSIPPAYRTLLEQALLRLEDLDARLHAPAAVLGLGLRLPPDVNRPQQLWDLLMGGGDAVGRVRPMPDGSRTAAEDAPGDAPGGFLARVDGFDAGFFGIPAAEAHRMDPHQRLLLEVAWEALEDAGIPAERLRGSRCGVFVGAFAQDWGLLQATDPDGPDAWTGPGSAHSILANRLSYLLDLTGPSLTVDTACSSSLTALHLALRALRAGDCDTAIVAGVHLVLSPYSSEVTGAVLPLSPGGRCRSFDADADGIVRGEGCVVLVLRRLADAERDGDPVLARVLGSAANHDGRTNGLTAPSPRAQADLLRAALADARLQPDAVAYVEAHGTGTALGDPIEMDALQAVYGAGTRRCAVGSLKATTGHLEAAAGLAGLVRALLVVEHGTVPGQPHLRRLNPEIRLDGGRLHVPVTPEPLDLPAGAAAVAAVSSFGFGGSNVHVLLAGEPAGRPGAGSTADDTAGDTAGPGEPGPLGSALVLPISAADDTALGLLRETWRRELEGADAATAARLCAAAARRRSHLPRRAAWAGADVAALRAELDDDPGTAPSTGTGEPLLVLAGQGSQWPAMGAGLLTVPALRPLLDRWEDEVRAVAGWSLRAALADPDPATLAATEQAQVCIAAVQACLLDLLRSWGVRPSGVLGHSMGEVVALAAAGGLDTTDTVTLLVERSRAMGRAAAGGAMLSVDLSADDVAALIAGRPGLDLAAVNAPDQVVISGDAEQVADVEQRLAARGVRHRRVPVDYAFHSPLLDGCDDDLTARLAGRVSPGAPQHLPMWSTVTGARLESAPPAGHWGRNLRGTVRFSDALRAAVAATGAGTVLELGPHPVLSGAVVRTLGPLGGPVTVLPALRRGGDSGADLARLAAALHAGGADLDWAQVLPGALPRTELPGYPWQHRRYWPAAVPPPRADVPGATEREQVPAGAGPGAGGSAPGPLDPRTVAPVAPVARTLPIEELTQFLCRRVARALDLDDVPAVPDDEPLEHWELPSLAVVDLRNQVERRFGMPVPLGVLLGGGTPKELAHRVLAGSDPAATGAAPPDPAGLDALDVAGLLDRIDDLTDDEVQRVLASLDSRGELA